MVLSNPLVSPISSDCSFPSSSFTAATMRGGSNPYCLASPSPISLFCLRSAMAETMASICVPSASAWIGWVSFHPVFSSGRVAAAKTLPSFVTRISRTFDLSSPSKTLAALSFFVSSLLTSFCTQNTAPATAPATTRKRAVVSSDFWVCFMGSTALPRLPDEQTGEEEAEGEDVEGHESHGVLLLGGEEEMIRLPAARTDCDLRFLVGRPADRVHRQVAISREPVEPVGSEVRVPEDDHSRFRVSASVRRGDGERHRALQVLAGRVLDLPVLDGIGLAPGARAGTGELHHRPAGRRRLDLRDAAGEREDAGERKGRIARSGDGVVGVVLRDGDLGLLRFGVDDLVVADLRAEAGQRFFQAALDARIDQGDELAALVDPSLDELRLAGGERRDGSGDDQDLRVLGHLLVGGELDLVHLEALALEPLHPELHAPLARVGDGVLAVSLGEVD